MSRRRTVNQGRPNTECRSAVAGANPGPPQQRSVKLLQRAALPRHVQTLLCFAGPLFGLGRLAQVVGVIHHRRATAGPQFDLEKMFPNSPHIEFAKELFKKCIVEHEEDCLPDAVAFLEEIDQVLSMINMTADLIGDDIKIEYKKIEW